MTTKVKQIEDHSDFIACAGQLILVIDESIKSLQKGRLYLPTDSGDKNDMTYGYRLREKDIEENDSFINKPILPIIISKTEQIEIDDYVFDSINQSLFQCKNRSHLLVINNQSSCYKVLVLSEQFSPVQIQAIVSGVLKDGQNLLIGCEIAIEEGKIVHHNNGYASTTDTKGCYQIKLTNNYINIFLIPKANQETKQPEISGFGKHLKKMMPVLGLEDNGIARPKSKEEKLRSSEEKLNPFLLLDNDELWDYIWNEYETYCSCRDFLGKEKETFPDWAKTIYNPPTKIRKF